MVRQRPIAGQRGRSRLGTDVPPAASGDNDEVARGRPTTVLDPPPVANGPRRILRRADALLLGALAVVVALAVAAAVLGLLLMRQDRAEDRVELARTEALAAAERHAVTLLSYDHRRLDRDFAAARKVLTGNFADDYAATTESVVRPTAEEVKAVVTAEVAASSVVRAGENRAVVLLFVDQTTTSTRLDGPRVDLNRVRMTLDRSGGQWLVSGVDAL